MTTTTTTAATGAARKNSDDDGVGEEEEEEAERNDCDDNNKNDEISPPPHVPLLDLRSHDSYERRRLRCVPSVSSSSSLEAAAAAAAATTRTVVHIPLSELRARSYELPPRSTPMAILVDDSNSSLDRALEILQPQRRDNEDDEDSTMKANKGNVQQRRKRGRHERGWKVAGAIIGNREATSCCWNDARELGILIEQGEEEAPPPPARKTRSFLSHGGVVYPYPRLWQPDALIRGVLLPLLRREVLLVRNNSEEKTYLEIYDLGSGSGRDVAFLAEELLSMQQQLNNNNHDKNTVMSSSSSSATDIPSFPSSFRVVAIDQRYRGDKHQQQIMDFLKRRGVESVTDCQAIDFNKADQVHEWLRLSSLSQSSTSQGTTTTTTKPGTGTTPETYCDDNKEGRAFVKTKFIKCFYAVRFWNKALVEKILAMSQDVSTKDTTIIFATSHFGKACPNQTEWNFKHPKPQNVLERYELRDMFVHQEEKGEEAKVELSSQWKILNDKVVRDNDHGRTLIQFVAQRVAY